MPPEPKPTLVLTIPNNVITLSGKNYDESRISVVLDFGDQHSATVPIGAGGVLPGQSHEYTSGTYKASTRYSDAPYRKLALTL